jgi:hypothetical protein
LYCILITLKNLKKIKYQNRKILFNIVVQI